VLWGEFFDFKLPKPDDQKSVFDGYGPVPGLYKMEVRKAEFISGHKKH